MDRLQNKFTHLKGIRNNTGSRQTTGIQEELDTTCKQDASRQTTQNNETLFPIWQKESWQTSEEAPRYVRPERVNKWPNSMTRHMMIMIKNPSRGSRVVQCGQIGRRDETNSRFSQFCERARNSIAPTGNRTRIPQYFSP